MCKPVHVLAVAAAVLLLDGCSRATLRADFGNSTTANIAVQTINHAGVADEKLQASDGQKLEKAIERYRNDSAQGSRGKLLSEMGN